MDLDVHVCMHDFEAALIKLIGRWFRCKHHIGCFFHWKQALCGKMVDMKFEDDVIKETLPMFDFLTVVEKGHIQKGVEYIRECANKCGLLKKWIEYYLTGILMSISSHSGFSRE